AGPTAFYRQLSVAERDPERPCPPAEKRAELRAARLTHGLEPLRRLEVAAGLCSVAQDPVGRRFVVLDGAGRLHVRREDGWAQEKLLAPVALTGLVAVLGELGTVGRFVGWGPAGLAILRSDLSLLWQSKPVERRVPGREPVCCLPVPDPGLLLVAEAGGSLALWKFRAGGRCLVPHGSPLRLPPSLSGVTCAPPAGPVTAVAVLPNTALVLSASQDGTLRTWDLQAAAQVGEVALSRWGPSMPSETAHGPGPVTAIASTWNSIVSSVQFGLGNSPRFDHRPQDDPTDHITGERAGQSNSGDLVLALGSCLCLVAHRLYLPTSYLIKDLEAFIARDQDLQQLKLGLVGPAARPPPSWQQCQEAFDNYLRLIYGPGLLVSVGPPQSLPSPGAADTARLPCPPCQGKYSGGESQQWSTVTLTVERQTWDLERLHGEKPVAPDPLSSHLQRRIPLLLKRRPQECSSNLRGFFPAAVQPYKDRGLSPVETMWVSGLPKGQLLPRFPSSYWQRPIRFPGCVPNSVVLQQMWQPVEPMGSREDTARAETGLHCPQFHYGHSLWEERYGHLPRFLHFFVGQNWFKKLFPIFTLQVWGSFGSTGSGMGGGGWSARVRRRGPGLSTRSLQAYPEVGTVEGLALLFMDLLDEASWADRVHILHALLRLLPDDGMQKRFVMLALQLLLACSLESREVVLELLCYFLYSPASCRISRTPSPVVSPGEPDSAALESQAQQTLAQMRFGRTRHALSETLTHFCPLPEAHLRSSAPAALPDELLPLEQTNWSQSKMLDLGPIDALNFFCEKQRARQQGPLQEEPKTLPPCPPPRRPSMVVPQPREPRHYSILRLQEAKVQRSPMKLRVPAQHSPHPKVSLYCWPPGRMLSRLWAGRTLDDWPRPAHPLPPQLLQPALQRYFLPDDTDPDSYS
ncbi:hypothetical protein E2I00_012096, partial [Balaenoptera physalus]